MGEQVSNCIGLDPTLNGAIATTPVAGTQETWTLSATGPTTSLPQRFPYMARIDDLSTSPDSPFELVKVTAHPSSTTATIKRGMGGTVSKTHANGSIFRQVLTSGGLNRLISGTQHRRRSGAIAETFSRIGAGVANLSGILVAGRRHLVAVELSANEIVTSITFQAGTAAASGQTHQWFEFLDDSRAILALTSDDLTAAWAAGAEKSLNLSAPFQTDYSGVYYLGIVCVGGVPSLYGVTGNGAQTGLAPITNGTSDTGITVPPTLPASAAAINATGPTPWGYCS